MASLLGTVALTLVGGLRCNVSRLSAYKLEEQRTCGLTVDLPTVRYGALSGTAHPSVYEGRVLTRWRRPSAIVEGPSSMLFTPTDDGGLGRGSADRLDVLAGGSA